MGRGRGLGDRQRHAEDGIGAEPALVGRAVERDQRLVDLDLGLGIHAADGIENLAVDRVDRLADPLAEIALAAVAQLDRLVRPGRGARRHRGAALRPVLEHDIDLDGRIAAAVEDFAADDVDDCGHGCSRRILEASPAASTGPPGPEAAKTRGGRKTSMR